jgi:hypothetical protein
MGQSKTEFPKMREAPSMVWDYGFYSSVIGDSLLLIIAIA